MRDLRASFCKPPTDGGKDISGCAISGIMSKDGRRFSGRVIMDSMSVMRERSSGLGGGFAAYGIYPELADHYAMHIMFDDDAAVEAAEAYLEQHCNIVHSEPIPTRSVPSIKSRPLLFRYFVDVREELFERYYDETEEDIVVRIVMHINREIDGAFVMSSGKNMGIFKGVGYPEEIGEFFRMDEYDAYIWLSHGRFPTNTTGWWGGAHPFGLLDWAVVHNGEISSYGINKRYLENFGYYCTLHTDTEVIAYLVDLLLRKHHLPLEMAAAVLAAPFWSRIERMNEREKRLYTTMRAVYGGALLNGPFSIVVGHSNGFFALNDRTKLRPMAVAEKDDMLYVASEEAAIRIVEPHPARLWHVAGGVPVVGELRGVGKEKVAG